MASRKDDSIDTSSPFFDSIRIKSKAEKNARPVEQMCQHPGCNAKGPHRAPAGRDREGHYIFLCAKHVAEYNKTYNYFAGMDDTDISAYQKDALTGHRPTWKLGANGAAQGSAPSEPKTGQYETVGLFSARRSATRRGAGQEARPTYGKLALKALAILHLDETATPESIRAKYKSWVKQLHPDANGGDRSREEKLREILKAYGTLRSAGLA
jgi:curved DNA-binding protein CbpA